LVILSDGDFGEESNVAITAVTFSPDETVIAIGMESGGVDLWHISSSNRLNTVNGLTAPATSLVYGPDGHRLASGNQDGNIQLWDVDTGKVLRTLKRHTATVTHLTFASDGDILVSGDQDGTVRLWYVDLSESGAPKPFPSQCIEE
jgi:WD40 repeat protein